LTRVGRIASRSHARRRRRRRRERG
jgi:hypothetical protein